MARKILGITMLWMVVTLTIPPLGFPSDLCNQAKKDFISAEKEWSSMNADITFLRDELERLRSLRWETKATLSVIEDALKMLGQKTPLTDAQRMTLNARIPSGKGTINPIRNVCHDLSHKQQIRDRQPGEITEELCDGGHD